MKKTGDFCMTVGELPQAIKRESIDGKVLVTRLLKTGRFLIAYVQPDKDCYSVLAIPANEKERAKLLAVMSDFRPPLIIREAHTPEDFMKHANILWPGRK